MSSSISAPITPIGLLALDAVGPSGEVHVFEPQPLLCDRVAAAIASSGKQNIVLHKFGLMDRDGFMSFAFLEEHTGAGSFVEHDFQSSSTEVKPLEVKNINTYLTLILKNKHISAKVDVEGAEPLILSFLFDQPNLRYVVFEATRNSNDIYQIASGKKFILYGLRRGLLKTELQLVTQEDALSGYFDVLAIRWKRNENPPAFIGPQALAGMLSQ